MSAWALDAPTWGWIFWLGWFLALESWALATAQPVHTLTFHLHPLFLTQPITWFLGVGLWLWIGVHIFAPAVEQWLIRSVG